MAGEERGRGAAGVRTRAADRERQAAAPRRVRAGLAALVAGGALALGGCASVPVIDGKPGTRLVERVDERTAVNVVALADPMLFTSARGRPSMPEDLALAPLEINRQGEKTWFLWLNLLGGDTRAAAPRLRIVDGGEVLVEVVLTASGTQLPLSRPPYRRLADWALEAYYPVSPADLARLRGRDRLAVEVAEGPLWIRFEAWEGQLAGLREFLDAQVPATRISGGS